MSQVLTKNGTYFVYIILGLLFLFAIMWSYAEFQIVYLEHVIERKLDTKITDDLFISVEDGRIVSALCKNYQTDKLFGFDRCEIAYKEMCKIPEYQEYSKCSEDGM